MIMHMPGKASSLLYTLAFFVLLGTQIRPLQAAGELLTLDEAVATALLENLSIANAELEISASESDLAAIKTRRLPNMDVRGSYTINKSGQDFIFEQGIFGDYPVIGEIPAEDVSIDSVDGSSGMMAASISQPLSQLYRISLGVEQSAVKIDAADQKLRMTQTEVSSRVKAEYFNIVQMKHQLATTEQSIVFYQSLQQLVSNYVEQQISLAYELLDVEARLAHRQAQLLTEQNDLITLKQRLNYLLNRDLNTAFSVEDLEEFALPDSMIPLDQALQTALTKKPEVEVSELEIDGAELGYKIKKSEYIPDVDLRLRYSRLFGTNFIPDEDTYVGVHAKWEFYDWGRKQHELHSKQAELQSAINSLEEVKTSTRINVERSYRAMADAREVLKAARLSEKAASEKLRVLKNQYDQQTALLQDVLDAESELSRASTAYNRAVLGVWRADAELQRSMGDI